MPYDVLELYAVQTKSRRGYGSMRVSANGGKKGAVVMAYANAEMQKKLIIITAIPGIMDEWAQGRKERDPRIRAKTFWGIANAMAEQWG